MNRFAIALFSVLLFVAAGCQSDKGGMTTSADACPGCPGVQSVKADGTCSGCGAKVMTSTSGDACSMCPGVQKATADGKCPDCKMKV